jgi:hypothetical protein
MTLEHRRKGGIDNHNKIRYQTLSMESYKEQPVQLTCIGYSFFSDQEKERR